MLEFGCLCSSSLVWIGITTQLSRAEVDGFLQFCRLLTGQAMGDEVLGESLVAREQDECCLEFLHKCGNDVAKAKFLLLSNMGAGTEVLLTQLHYNRLEEKMQRKLSTTGNGSVGAKSGQPADLEKSKPVSSNGSVPAAGLQAAGNKKVNWKKWAARAKNVCSGKTAASRETLYILLEETMATESVPEHAAPTLKALQAKLEAVDDWIAQAHDAVSQVKPDGRWTLAELKTLVNKKPKGVKLAEEAELQKLVLEWTVLKEKVDFAVQPNPQEQPLHSLISLYEAAVELPLDLRDCLFQLKQRISHAQSIAESICAALPRTLRWKPPSSSSASAMTLSWTRRSTAELESLQAKARDCGVSFFERKVVDLYLKKAEDWRSSAKAALAKNSNVRELVSLLKRADAIPIDLSEEKRLFDEQIKAAQGWLKKVKGAVPKVGKTRETANARKMDLDTLRTFRDEASTLGMDLTEANHISEVVLSAEDWQKRVKELTLRSRGQDSDAHAQLTQLRELLDEGEQLPVRMDRETQILQVEVSMLEWEQKLHDALAARPAKLGVEHYETMLQDFLKLRKLLPSSIKNRGNWKADKERLVRRTLSNAKDWLRKAHVLAVRDPQSWLALSPTRQREIINDKASLLGDHFTLEKLALLVHKAQDLPVDLGSEIAPLDELKVLVESKRKRFRALMVITKQPEAAEFAGESTEVDEELCRDMLEEGTLKTSIIALERELSLAAATGVHAKEFDFLQLALERAEDWMNRFHAVFESAAKADKKRKRDETIGPVSVEAVQTLLERASELAIDVQDPVEQLSHALEAVSEWRTSAQQLLDDYTRNLKQAPVTRDNHPPIVLDEIGLETPVPSTSARGSRRDLEPTSEESAYFEKFMASLPTVSKEEASRLEDFAAEAHTMNAAKNVLPAPWTTELTAVMERVAGFVRETRRKSISRIVLPLTEYKYCLWILRGKAWCGRAADCISCHKTMRIEELKRFVTEGTQLITLGLNPEPKADAAIVSTRTSKRMRSSSTANESEGQNGVVVTQGEEPFTLENEANEAEEGSEADSEGADEVSAAEVEGSEFASFRGLGHTVEMHLSVLQRWARRALQWQRVSRAFIRSEAKSYSFGLRLKALLKLKHDLGLNVAVEEEKQMRSELKRARSWLEKAQGALHGTPTSEQIESLLLEGGKLKCGLPEYDLLKETLQQGKAWLSEVKRSGIERGEASVDQLQQLLEDSKTIKMDLGKHTAILQQATRLYCLCRAPFDGLMIACDKCEDWFHTACVNITQKALRKIGKYTCPTCQIKRVLAVQRSLAKTTLFKVTLVASATKNPLVGRYASWITSTFADVFEQARQDVDVAALKRTLQEGPGADLTTSAHATSFLVVLKNVLWCSNAIRRLRQKCSIETMHELLSEAPKDLESAKGVIELLQGITDRGDAWVMRAKAVMNAPLEMSKHKILSECKQLLKQSVHLPLVLKEEKLLNACMDDDAARYCLCKGFNDGGFMIGCDKCEDWFHGKCVNLTKEVGDTLSSWTCPGCRQNQDEATTTPAVEKDNKTVHPTARAEVTEATSQSQITTPAVEKYNKPVHPTADAQVVKAMSPSEITTPALENDNPVHPTADTKSAMTTSQSVANGVVPNVAGVSVAEAPGATDVPIVTKSDNVDASEPTSTSTPTPSPAPAPTSTATATPIASSEGEKGPDESTTNDVSEAKTVEKEVATPVSDALGLAAPAAATEEPHMNGKHEVDTSVSEVGEPIKAVDSATMESKAVADVSVKQDIAEIIQAITDKVASQSMEWSSEPKTVEASAASAVVMNGKETP